MILTAPVNCSLRVSASITTPEIGGAPLAHRLVWQWQLTSREMLRVRYRFSKRADCYSESSATDEARRGRPTISPTPYGIPASCRRQSFSTGMHLRISPTLTIARELHTSSSD